MFKSLAKAGVGRFPRAAMGYRAVRDEIDNLKASEVSPWGFTLAGSSLMASGSFETKETESFRELIQECDLLVNVGANVGYYCCHALSVGVPSIAIEPHPRNVRMLLRNIAENGWGKQSHVLPVAAGAESGVLPIFGGGTGASLLRGWAGTSGEYAILVPVVPLDDLVSRSVNGMKPLVWVDVEGAELEVLRGAQELLQQTPRPIWVMEVTLREHQPNQRVNPNFEETFQMFFEAGYSVSALESRNCKLSMKDIADIATSGLPDDLGHTFIMR